MCWDGLGKHLETTRDECVLQVLISFSWWVGRWVIGGGVCFVVLCVVFFGFGLKKMKIEMFFFVFCGPCLGVSCT